MKHGMKKRSLNVTRFRNACPAASRPARTLVLSFVLSAAAPTLWAQPAPAGAPSIYSCVDANGKRLTSDRPIAECMTRDQRVLNTDGSVKRVVPPTLTQSEHAEQDARERQLANERSAQQDAARRDRSLLLRFPNEAAHRQARANALDDVRKAIAFSEKRMVELAAERKPLLNEAEFYAGKPLPRRLKQQLDAVDASTEAQRALIANQQAELVRINALYDAELERLRQLWSGSPPGRTTTSSAPRP